jgi:hypothetical protein
MNVQVMGGKLGPIFKHLAYASPQSIIAHEMFLPVVLIEFLEVLKHLVFREVGRSIMVHDFLLSLLLANITEVVVFNIVPVKLVLVIERHTLTEIAMRVTAFEVFIKTVEVV